MTRRPLQPRGEPLSSSHIGGELDWRRLAEAHRPTEPSALAVEVRRLHGTGWSARDIASALRLDIVFVLELIQRADR
jgi:hypothetical protein